jgi:plastocyanin
MTPTRHRPAGPQPTGLRPAGVAVRTAAVLALALLAGCASWGPEGGPAGIGRATAPSPAKSDAPAVAATPGPDGVQRITVSLTDDLRFVPDRVSAKPGVIEFRLQNVGVTPHTMTVATAPAGTVNGGRTAVLRVRVTRPGAYPFPCAYHAESGMRGVLEVG